MPERSQNGEVSDPPASVFEALTDEHHRVPRDPLYGADRQSLAERCEMLPDTTRFGVTKHLEVLDDAHLVVTERDGRRKRHLLGPVPIREVHDRRIPRHAEPHAAGLLALRDRAEGA